MLVQPGLERVPGLYFSCKTQVLHRGVLVDKKLGLTWLWDSCGNYFDLNRIFGPHTHGNYFYTE